LFNLDLNKLLTKEILQNLNLFNNFVNVLYTATSFEHNIVKKNYK